MKIIYFLKKGFQFYPPCLSQVLMLNDLGADLEVYHGINSTYINNILDSRKIKHYVLKSDNLKESKLESVKKIFLYKIEVQKIIAKISKSTILWFGNCESSMMLEKCLDGRKFITSILELYDDQKWIDFLLKRILPKATLVVCCEKHRAALMKSRYGLKKFPVIMPNKAYEFKREIIPSNIDESVLNIIQEYTNNKIVLYQGIIERDRPLSNIAYALKAINDSDIIFWIMGKGNMQLVNELKTIYPQTVYLGFIPSPQHMMVTQHAYIGIANYDYSNLNNVFCAPNKIYEYSKYGIPMLTSDNIGLVETVGASGAAECVDFSNVKKVKEGLCNILEKYELYHKNAIRFYEQVDNTYVMKLIYKELL